MMGDWRSRARAMAAVAVAVSVGALAGCATNLQVQNKNLPQVASAAAVAAPEIIPEPNWRDYFGDVRRGGIIVSVKERRLFYWGPNGEDYATYPVAVPRSADLVRFGETRIVRKREQPDWRPTPDMVKRIPDLPEYIGPGPENPMGEHAMYLGWTYYAIHGTNNPASIGRPATSGCIRLFPKDIAELFGKTKVGTPVQVVAQLAPPSAATAAVDDASDSAPAQAIAAVGDLGRSTLGALNVPGSL